VLTECLIAVMVKHENFKTCSQSGFCKRNRDYADSAAAASATWTSPYTLDSSSIKFQDGELKAVILKAAKGESVRLPVTISFLETGTARVTIDEEKRQKGEIELRHDSKARKERYNEAGKWSIVGSLKNARSAAIADGAASGTTIVNYGPANKYQAVIRHAPFGLEFKRDGVTQIQFNDRGLLNVEHWRKQVEKDANATEGEAKEGETEKPAEEDDSTWWDESFGGNTDSKPRGPEAIALDISFPGFEHVYGIPEHASSMSLKTTRFVYYVVSWNVI
jgi:alpha 1,3-glucosidase